MLIQIIQQRIYEVRGQRIMIDQHLAQLYEVPTKQLNLSVKRNIKRFPTDFMFQLTKDEWDVLRFQIETLEKGKGKFTKYLPYAFTEHGVTMLASILNSERAITVNVAIVRAFILLRQYYMDYKELKLHIEKLEKEMNRKFKDINEALKYLLNPPLVPRKKIGYK
jgi:hypothetical protein